MDKQTRFHVRNSGKFCHGIFLSLCIHLNEIQQQGQATWIAKFQSRSLLSNVTKKSRLNSGLPPGRVNPHHPRLLTDVVLAEQLHPHHGKDEDDNAEHKRQIT